LATKSFSLPKPKCLEYK